MAVVGHAVVLYLSDATAPDSGNQRNKPAARSPS
jgi:hypothetical protein